MLMHKILQNNLLCAFVANLKIDAIYALYPESFCDKNLAIRKVFAFCDSGGGEKKIGACHCPNCQRPGDPRAATTENIMSAGL